MHQNGISVALQCNYTFCVFIVDAVSLRLV